MTRYVGLKNNASTCYLNCLLQTLYMTPEFRNGIYQLFCGGNASELNRSIPYQLQRLFVKLQTSDDSCVESAELTKSFGWQESEVVVQQDIEELCRVFFSALEKRLIRMNNNSLIKNLYEGQLLDYVKCEKCGAMSSRTEAFFDLSLPIKTPISSIQCRSLEEALNNYCKPENLGEDNMIDCSKCQKKRLAIKGLKFTKLPYIFVVQLNRMEYNTMTRKRVKLNDYVEFPEFLDLNEFCEHSLAGEEWTPASGAALFEKRFDTARQNAINKILQKGPYLYELFSVIAHTGTAEGGHYFAYIKNLDKNNWLCFDDESVTLASMDNVKRTFGDPKIVPNTTLASGNFATAYMFFYRQCDEKRNKMFIQDKELPANLKMIMEKVKCEHPVPIDEKIKVPIYAVDATNGRVDMVIRLNCEPKTTLGELMKMLNDNFQLKAQLTKYQKRCRLIKYNPNTGHLLKEIYSSESENSICVCDVLHSDEAVYLEILPSTLQAMHVFNNGALTIRLFYANCQDFTISCFGLILLNRQSTVAHLLDCISDMMKCDLTTVVAVLVYFGRTLKVLDLNSKELLADALVENFDVYFSLERSSADAQDVIKEFETSSMYNLVTLFMNLMVISVELLPTVFFSTRRMSLIGQVTQPFKVAIENGQSTLAILEKLKIESSKTFAKERRLPAFLKSQELCSFQILTFDTQADPKRLEIWVDNRLKLKDFKEYLRQKLRIDSFRIYKCSKGKRYHWKRETDPLHMFVGFDKMEIDEEEMVEDTECISYLIRIFWRGVTNQLPSFRFKIVDGSTLKCAKADIVQHIIKRYNIDLRNKVLRMRTPLPGRLAILDDDATVDCLKENKELWIEILPDGSKVGEQFSLYTRQWYPSKLQFGPVFELNLRKPYTQGELLNRISNAFEMPIGDIEVSSPVKDKYFPFETSKLDIVENIHFYPLISGNDISEEPIYLSDQGRMLFVQNKNEKPARISWRKRQDLLNEEQLIESSSPTFTKQRQRTLRINSLLSSSIADDEMDV